LKKEKEKGVKKTHTRALAMTISVTLIFLSFCSFLCFLGTRAAKIQNPCFRPLPGLKKNVGAPVLPPTLRFLLLTASIGAASAARLFLQCIHR
jgi:hypothetical protein